MAKVRSFIYCEEIEQQPTPTGPKANIIGPIGEINLMGIPSFYSFSVACTIVELDSTKVNELQIHFVAPNGELLNDTGVIEIPILEEKIAKSLQMNLRFNNLPFREEGEFVTKVYFNGEEIDRFPISAHIDNI